MSRTGASNIHRGLGAVAALVAICGCGDTARRTASHHQDQPGRLQPLAAAVQLAARPMADSRVAPASYPIFPLPPVEVAGDDIEAWGPALCSPDGARPQDHPLPPNNPPRPPALSPDAAAASPELAEAYAVKPRPSLNNDGALPLAGASEPTPQLVAVARRADAHIARGMALAERGAIYTARAELTRALRLSAAALDEQRRTAAHTGALEKGLRALNEAEELARAASARPGSSLESLVRGHRTPVAPEAALDEPELNAVQALQRYLSVAQEHLAAAGGDLQPAASALYALGKMEMTAAAGEVGSLPSARAAVYLQAALVVNPRHALAANELGVLLARHGRLDEAKAALLHAVQIAPLPVAWRNLAIVYHDLGEHDLARRADWQSRQLAHAAPQATPPADPNAPAVQWVDPATFAQAARSESDAPAATRGLQNGKTTSAKSNATSASSGAPWSRHTR